MRLRHCVHVCERNGGTQEWTLRTEAAARQARFIAERRAFSFDGAWYPAPRWTATKNLLELSWPPSAAIGLPSLRGCWLLQLITYEEDILPRISSPAGEDDVITSQCVRLSQTRLQLLPKPGEERSAPGPEIEVATDGNEPRRGGFLKTQTRPCTERVDPLRPRGGRVTFNLKIF